MGVALRDIIEPESLELKQLSGKVLAFDSFNLLYQFITTIRQPDGSLFTDSKGKPTSHLIGLFSRLTKFLEAGIKPVFVFDGQAPELKQKERQRRKELKEEAKQSYLKAVADKDIDAMKRYASRASTLSELMIEDSKILIAAFGLPVVIAPSEGEAQAAKIVANGDAFAVVSQDFDALLYGASRLIRNLSISGKRKKSNKLSYEKVKPELILLPGLLNSLGIDREQLIALAMLVGTDFNNGGIKGIGPKKALDAVKRYKKDFDVLFEAFGWDKHFDMPWSEVYYTIKNMPVTDNYNLSFKNPDYEKIIGFLCKEHDFSFDRVSSSLEKLKKSTKKSQKSLGDFFS